MCSCRIIIPSKGYRWEKIQSMKEVGKRGNMRVKKEEEIEREKGKENWKEKMMSV